jgi:pimeloyl-ACP methyl ester carboxylesterase
VNDLAQLASGKRTVIFGHSLGGAYALALASSQQRPKELLGVSVFEAPLPGLNWWGDWEIPRESAACGDFEPEFAHRIAKEFMIQSIGESAWNSLPEKTKALRQKEGTTLLIELAQLHLGELRIDFSQLDLPLQWGISQKIGPRHLASYDKVKNILDATFYCVPGAGHGAHITHPQALAQALHQLLETVSKS